MRDVVKAPSLSPNAGFKSVVDTFQVYRCLMCWPNWNDKPWYWRIDRSYPWLFYRTLSRIDLDCPDMLVWRVRNIQVPASINFACDVYHACFTRIILIWMPLCIGQISCSRYQINKCRRFTPSLTSTATQLALIVWQLYLLGLYKVTSWKLLSYEEHWDYIPQEHEGQYAWCWCALQC